MFNVKNLLMVASTPSFVKFGVFKTLEIIIRIYLRLFELSCYIRFTLLGKYKILYINCSTDYETTSQPPPCQLCLPQSTYMLVVNLGK